jgi:hypothetical protein
MSTFTITLMREDSRDSLDVTNFDNLSITPLHPLNSAIKIANTFSNGKAASVLVDYVPGF